MEDRCLGIHHQAAGELASADLVIARAGLPVIRGIPKDPSGKCRSVRMSAYSTLGNIYCDLGDYLHAKENYEAALRIDPDNPYARLGLGLLAERAGDLSQAADDYAVLVKGQPNDVGYLLLARALQKAGRTAEAQAAHWQAAKLSGNFSQAQQTTANMSLP
jgi:tetratricopeptide (TPR) repeat protein